MLPGLLISLLLLAAPVDAARVKDIASVYGVRENVLFGYGLVTGLRRTGDSRRNEATIRSLANRLQGLGITLDTDDIISRNVAVVMVTSRLPADTMPGHRIDCEVSSVGDATSLEGGILLLTPLYATTGQAFASAQGPLVIGGYSAEAGGTSVRKNTTTVGRVPEGAIVERENPYRLDLQSLDQVLWLVKQPDFTTATRVARSMNEKLGGDFARARDSGTVVLKVPDEWKGKVVDLIALLEVVDVQVDTPARVVINERTGTVVMGADVRVSAVAVSYGGLSIEIKRQTEVVQPAPLSGGRTAAATNQTVTATEEEGRLALLEGVTIGDLVATLNGMGVKPRDLIEILLAMRAAGALHAEVESL